jgi:hypothetical protein
MNRLHKRLFRIGDALSRLAEEERLVAAELEVNRHLDDDARRDAAVGGSPLDREDARETAADVARGERLLSELGRRRVRLEARRRRLLARLG